MNTLAERSGLILRKVKLPHGERPVYQSAVGQGISSDAATLAGQVLADHDETPRTLLELGCGTGIVSLTLAGYRPAWSITGIDIQPQLIDIARVNAGITGSRVAFRTDDLTLADFDGTRFDLIVGNPPYYPLAMGRISPRPEKAVARHELACTLSDVFRCVDRSLAPDGTAYLMYPAFRDPEIADCLYRHRLTATVCRIIPSRRPGAATHIWRIRRTSHAEN